MIESCDATKNAHANAEIAESSSMMLEIKLLDVSPAWPRMPESN